MDPAVRCTIETGSQLTRTNHIDANWSAPGTVDFPDEWTMEHEIACLRCERRGR
jgi:hypothetical protein